MALDRGHTSPSAAGLQQEDGPIEARGYPGMAATGSSPGAAAAWTNISGRDVWE